MQQCCNRYWQLVRITRFVSKEKCLLSIFIRLCARCTDAFFHNRTKVITIVHKLHAKPFFHSVKWPVFELILSAAYRRNATKFILNALTWSDCVISAPFFSLYPWTMQNAINSYRKTRSSKLITATSIDDDDVAQENCTISRFLLTQTERQMWVWASSVAHSTNAFQLNLCYAVICSAHSHSQFWCCWTKSNPTFHFVATFIFVDFSLMQRSLIITINWLERFNQQKANRLPTWYRVALEMCLCGIIKMEWPFAPICAQLHETH